MQKNPPVFHPQTGRFAQNQFAQPCSYQVDAAFTSLHLQLNNAPRRPLDANSFYASKTSRQTI
jgi:hypothetical protein